MLVYENYHTVQGLHVSVIKRINDDDGGDHACLRLRESVLSVAARDCAAPLLLSPSLSHTHTHTHTHTRAHTHTHTHTHIERQKEGGGGAGCECEDCLNTLHSSSRHRVLTLLKDVENPRNSSAGTRRCLRDADIPTIGVGLRRGVMLPTQCCMHRCMSVV